MGFNLHADNDDPPQVRNWRVHLMALIVSMGAIASKGRLPTFSAWYSDFP